MEVGLNLKEMDLTKQEVGSEAARVYMTETYVAPQCRSSSRPLLEALSSVGLGVAVSRTVTGKKNLVESVRASPDMRPNRFEDAVLAPPDLLAPWLSRTTAYSPT